MPVLSRAPGVCIRLLIGLMFSPFYGIFYISNGVGIAECLQHSEVHSKIYVAAHNLKCSNSVPMTVFQSYFAHKRYLLTIARRMLHTCSTSTKLLCIPNILQTGCGTRKLFF